MEQETNFDFSVIKQKIINTDEIVRMYQETNNKLKKVAQAYREVKLKYDQTVLNLSRFELENERCTFNLENMKLNNDRLERENKELCNEKSLLQGKYNQQTVQYQLEIKRLEDELKDLQEGKLTANFKSKKKDANSTYDRNDKECKALEEEIRKLKRNETIYKKEIEDLNLKNEKLTNNLVSSKHFEYLKKLEMQNKALLDEVDRPNFQVEGEQPNIGSYSYDQQTLVENVGDDKDKEIRELKLNISCLADKSKLTMLEEENEKLKHQLMNQELVLFHNSERKSTSDFCIQTDILSVYKNSAHLDNHIKRQLNTISNTEVECKEIANLKKKISSLIIDKNKLESMEEENEKLKQQLMNQEMTLFNIKDKKSSLDFRIQTDTVPKNKKRSICVQTLDSIEPYKLETFQRENQKLKKFIIDYERQIKNLKVKLKSNRKHSYTKTTQTEELGLDVEYLEDILKEMCAPIPNMLSPMSPALYEDLELDITPTPLSVNTNILNVTPTLAIIPDVIVTPPTPTTESVLHFENGKISSISPKEEHFQEKAINFSDKNKDNLDSRKSCNELPCFKRAQRRRYRSPVIGNEFVKLRKRYVRYPVILKTEIFRKDIKKARKPKHQDCILKALQTLRRSKINFTISNESTLPKCWPNNNCPLIYSDNHSHLNNVRPKVFVPRPKYKNAKYLREKLGCNLPSCGRDNSYMLLSKKHNLTELLGFFNVKNEMFTPSCSRIDHVLDGKPSNFIGTINSTLTDGTKLTSESILETLADLVSSKLKERKNMKRTFLNNDFESFNSETETELEKLLENPTHDILGRNKLLFKQAQQQKKYHSMCSSLDQKDIDGKITDRHNQSAENIPVESLNPSEHTPKCNKKTSITKSISANTYVETVLQHVDKNNSSIKKLAVVGEEVEDSCDSMECLPCPELISPLSNTSKGIETPPSNLQILSESTSGKQLDIYFEPKAIDELPTFNVKETNISNMVPNKAIGNNIYSCQTVKKLENENISIKISKTKKCFRDFPSVTIPFNSPKNFTDCLNGFSALNTVSKYLDHDRAMPDVLNRHLRDFEENNCLLQHSKEIRDTQMSNKQADSGGGILHLRSLLNEDTSSFESKIILEKLYGKNAISEYGNEDNFDIQNINYYETEQGKNNNDFSSINNFNKVVKDTNDLVSSRDLSEVCINLNPEELPPKEHGVIIWNCAQGMSKSTSIEEKCFIKDKECEECNISDSPKSPIQEEVDSIKPITIPLEIEAKDSIVTDNINKDILNFPGLINKNPKMPSPIFTYDHQKKNQMDSVNVVEMSVTTNCSHTPKFTEKLVTHKVPCLRVFRDNKIESTHVNSVGPNSKYVPSIEKFTEPFNSIIFNQIQELEDKSLTDLTTDILSALKNEEDESVNIPSCPQSPINDDGNKLGFMIPKIIPLENLRSRVVNSLFSETCEPDSCSPKKILDEKNITSRCSIIKGDLENIDKIDASSSFCFHCTDSVIKKSLREMVNLKNMTISTQILQENLTAKGSTSKHSDEDMSKCHSSIDSKIVEPVDTDMTSSNQISKSIKDLTSGILDVLQAKEIENVNTPSCPQSPISYNYSNEVDITVPKTIPLQHVTNESVSTIPFFSVPPKLNEPDPFSTQHNITEKYQNSEYGSLKVNKCNSHTNNETTTLHGKRKTSLLAPQLRRSKRNLNRNKNIFEITSKNDDHNECACKTNVDETDDSPILKHERLKKRDKSQSSHSLQSVSPEMVIQVKRKRGRPRKQVTEKIELLQIENMNPSEDHTSDQEKEKLSYKKDGSPERKRKKDVNAAYTEGEESVKESMELGIMPIDNLMNEVDQTELSKNSTQAVSLIMESNCDDGNLGRVCKSNLSSVIVKNDKLSNINKNEKTVSRNRIDKRKTMTKLKSNILKQFKEKRKMFQTNVDITSFVNNSDICDLKGNKESNIDVSQTNVCVSNKNELHGTTLVEGCTSKICDTKQDSNIKKINIVQNILILPNSDYAVDLLERKECANHEIALNCDIKLDVPDNSSQNSVNEYQSPLQKNTISVSTNAKKKRVKCVKKKLVNENDVLSKIMEEMNKGKPNISPSKINRVKEDIPTGINDREWRKSILEIAESTHAVTDETCPLSLISNKHSLAKNLKGKSSKKVQILMSRLVKLSSDEKIASEIILEFKRQSVDNIAEIILQKVSRDIVDKAEDKYYPAPLMTKTQRILLSLMVQLENDNIENLMDTFLNKAEVFLFKRGCGIRAMVPITRLYMAVCRLRSYVNRIRTFCCNAFLFMGDLAIPLLFTVLTSWSEILPMESDLKYYPLTKVLVQVVHLKGCHKPGYNLLPLRMLLNQFYGYPKERWNCDGLFEELFHQYLRNPVASTDLAVRLLCKNKDTKWVYKKVNEFLKPLIYKIPAQNVNFKATAVILIGKICKQFKPYKEPDQTYLTDLRRWLIGLTEGDEVSDIVERSVDLSLSMIPKKQVRKKNSNKKVVKAVQKVAKKKNRFKTFEKEKTIIDH